MGGHHLRSPNCGGDSEGVQAQRKHESQQFQHFIRLSRCSKEGLEGYSVCARSVAVAGFGLDSLIETADVMRRLADGVEPDVITRAEAAAGSVPGVIHAHARARWTGRTLRVEIEGWIDPDTTARDADALGRLVAEEISAQLPEAGSLTWTTRAAPIKAMRPGLDADLFRLCSSDADQQRQTTQTSEQ